MTFKYNVCVYGGNCCVSFFGSNSRNAKKHLREKEANRVDVFRYDREGTEILVSTAYYDKGRDVVMFGAVRK